MASTIVYIGHNEKTHVEGRFRMTIPSLKQPGTSLSPGTAYLRFEARKTDGITEDVYFGPSITCMSGAYSLGSDYYREITSEWTLVKDFTFFNYTYQDDGYSIVENFDWNNVKLGRYLNDSGAYIANVFKGAEPIEMPLIHFAPVLSTASTFADNTNLKITYKNRSKFNASRLQAMIKYSYNENNYSIVRDIPKDGTSYTFSLTEAELTALRLATASYGGNTMNVTISIENEIEGAVYTSSLQKVFTIVNPNPIISPTIRDANSKTINLTGNSNVLVKYASNAAITIGAQAVKGATLKSQKVTNGSQYITTDNTIIFNVDSDTFYFVVEDNKGNVSTRTITTPFVDYIKLTCNVDSGRPDVNGNFSFGVSGNFFNQNFGAATNTIVVEYRYKQYGGTYSNWTSIPVSLYGNTYSASHTITGLDYRQMYIVQARATDRLYTVESIEHSVRSLPIFHWSDSDFVFEVPVTFNAGAEGIEGGGGSSSEVGNDIEGDCTINGNCTITGNLRLKGNGNYGNSLYFGDGSYVNFSEITDDDLTLKATDFNLNVSNFNFNQRSVVYGEWTPTLTTSGAVSSYTTQKGWYQKLGSVVTIGWQIKANINSGYQTTNISISGVPYTPAYDATGGGICSGVYMSAGFNFECWAVNTSGVITGRVQACNNTAAANLSTSASGCFYRSGGGEITIGGTISYLTNA